MTVLAQIDELRREYRVVASSDASALHFDLERMDVLKPLVMNVRVPRRTREEREEISKDPQKRRSLAFLFAGETVELQYSEGLWSVQ